MYFKAHWMIRPSSAAEIRPAVLDATFRVGRPKWGVLVKLKASKRNCSLWPSQGMAKFFDSRKSKLFQP